MTSTLPPPDDACIIYRNLPPLWLTPEDNVQLLLMSYKFFTSVTVDSYTAALGFQMLTFLKTGERIEKKKEICSKSQS